MAIVRPIFGYGAVCWDRTEGQVRVLNGVQKRAVKFVNNINVLGWEALAQRRFMVQISALFTALTGRQSWKATGNRPLKTILSE